MEREEKIQDMELKRQLSVGGELLMAAGLKIEFRESDSAPTPMSFNISASSDLESGGSSSQRAAPQKLPLRENLNSLQQPPFKIAALVGATVKVIENPGGKNSYQLVESSQEDPSKRKFGIDSPIGQALYFPTIGEKHDVELPNGHVISFEIVEVTNPNRKSK